MSHGYQSGSYDDGSCWDRGPKGTVTVCGLPAEDHDPALDERALEPA